MKLTTLAAAALVGLTAAGGARAGTVLDRVRANGGLSCGAEERAGFADAGDGGPVHGLAVDLCRALAVAVLGPDAKVDFTIVDSVEHFDKLRAGAFDVAFLSGGTLLGENLVGRLSPGPPAFVEADALMVPDASEVRSPRDLAGTSVCFMIGTGAQRAMEAAFERDGVAMKRLGFGEDVELRDAYNVGRCGAVAGEATFLAEVRQDGGVHGVHSRILDAPLAVDPVFAVTGIEDGRWSAMVGWAVQALVLGSAPRSGWTGRGGAPLAEAATPLGFRPGWYDDVERSVGTYAEMVRRDLGDGSDLKLATGPNAAWPAGVLLVPASP